MAQLSEGAVGEAKHLSVEDKGLLDLDGHYKGYRLPVSHLEPLMTLDLFLSCLKFQMIKH